MSIFNNLNPSYFEDQSLTRQHGNQDRQLSQGWDDFAGSGKFYLTIPASCLSSLTPGMIAGQGFGESSPDAATDPGGPRGSDRRQPTYSGQGFDPYSRPQGSRSGRSGSGPQDTTPQSLFDRPTSTRSLINWVATLFTISPEHRELLTRVCDVSVT